MVASLDVLSDNEIHIIDSGFSRVNTLLMSRIHKRIIKDDYERLYTVLREVRYNSIEYNNNLSISVDFSEGRLTFYCIELRMSVELFLIDFLDWYKDYYKVLSAEQEQVFLDTFRCAYGHTTYDIRMCTEALGFSERDFLRTKIGLSSCSNVTHGKEVITLYNEDTMYCVLPNSRVYKVCVKSPNLYLIWYNRMFDMLVFGFDGATLIFIDGNVKFVSPEITVEETHINYKRLRVLGNSTYIERRKYIH